MSKRPRPGIDEDKFLSKTQEVHYQKEFKRANKIYDSITQRGNRS